MAAERPFQLPPDPRRVADFAGLARDSQAPRPTPGGSELEPRLPMPKHRLSRLPLLALAGLSGISTPAQCDPQWRVGAGHQGLRGSTRTLVDWDPDGAGPRSPVVVVGGYFVQAGSVVAANVVAYDAAASAFAALGDLPAQVLDLAVLTNGRLVAAVLTGGPGPSIYQWTGQAWQPIGVGDGTVYSLLAMPNGDLLAGGDFRTMGGTAAARVARFDGTAWHAVGGTQLASVGGGVRDLMRRANGDLVAVGILPLASAGMQKVIRFDGTNWLPMAGGPLGVHTSIEALELPNGDLVVASFTGTPQGLLHRFDGTQWTTLATADSGITDLALAPNGDLLVAGAFQTIGGITAPQLARFDGTAWHPAGSASGGSGDSIHCIHRLPGGELLLGGNQRQFAGIPAEGLVRWNGAVATPPTFGNVGGIQTVQVLGPNDYLVTGAVGALGGSPVHGVARGDGVTWTTFGSGPGVPAPAVAVRPNGELIAAGYQFVSGNPIVAQVNRWNGTTWLPLATADGPIEAIVAMPNGDIVVGGGFATIAGVAARYLARWNGTTWAPVGNFLGASVTAMLVMRNGDLVVGGRRSGLANPPSPSNLARFDGTTWTALGSGTSDPSDFSTYVYALAELPNGDLVAGGVFPEMNGTTVGDIARWDGVAWHALAGGASSSFDAVYSLAVLPDGDLVAGGSFVTIGGQAAAGLARWDGSQWSELAGGIQGRRQTGDAPTALATTAAGDLVVAGSFIGAGGTIATNFAVLQPPCRAAVTTFAPGCPSSGGANDLAADRPWTGAPWTLQGSGLPANGFALACTGLVAVNLPLALFVPQSPAGCTLVVAPQAVVVLPLQNGTARLQFTIPADPALAGVQLLHQMLPVEVGQTGIQSVTATAAVGGTMGTF